MTCTASNDLKKINVALLIHWNLGLNLLPRHKVAYYDYQYPCLEWPHFKTEFSLWIVKFNQ